VEVVVAGNGIVVQGDPSAVTAFIDGALDVVPSSRPRRVLADGLAVAGSIAALQQTYREYFEFSPRALELLKEHGAIPTKDGFFRSFVRSGPNANSPFGGHLDWKRVDLGPEQALAVQTAVTTLALRAAIAEVAEAVERVEGKVDKLVSLARAERLGRALGDRHTLHALAEQTRASGRISQTDWSTVASLGTLISRDVATLRAYIVREVQDVEQSSFARQRSAELRDMTDDLIKESLALLIVAELNYLLWQELRVAHVATHERKLLAQTTADVRAQLEAMALADQRMLDAVHQAASDLLDPSGYEGFAPISRHRLEEGGKALSETISWFARERQLLAAPIEVELPTLGESVVKAKEVAASAFNELVHRSSNDDEPDKSDPTA